jgi:hypothetical protein
VSKGDGAEEQALADVRGARAASWGITRPAGVTRSLQVLEYMVDPRPLSRFFKFCINLVDNSADITDERFGNSASATCITTGN